MSLRDLDDRLVPRLAAALDRMVRKLPTPPEPTGPATFIVRLRRIDDRYASGGPLALLRDVPQLGAVAIGALVLASGVTVASRTQPRQEPPPAAQDLADPGLVSDGTLGPDLGENVPAYLDATKARLRALAPGRPDGMVVAVISLSSYRTAEQVRDLVGPLQVRQIFYRAPMKLPLGIVRTAEVEDVAVDSKREFQRVARLRQAEANELRKVAATIENDPEQKTEHEKDARIYSREAELLRGRCACVYGLVVQARLRMLVDLLNLPTVRTIDVSEVGADLTSFTFSALLPEETVTVTGGNQEG